MSEQTKQCNNCESQVQGAYCSNCGQRTSVHKVTFGEIIQDFVDAVFSVNGPFVTTLTLIFTNPGRLFRDYLAGKRKRYYKPVAFFILMTIVYLVVRSLIQYDPFGNTTIQVRDESSSRILTEARNFMLLNIDKLLFVFVFNLALLLKLLFYRKYSLVEFIAVSFYLVSVYTILTILNMFFIHYIDSGFQLSAMIAMMLYFCYAMVSFFQRKKVLVVIKSIFIFWLGVMSYGLTAFGISLLIVWLRQG